MLDMPFGSKRDREEEREGEKETEGEWKRAGRERKAEQQLSSGLAWLSAKSDCVARELS